MARGSTNSLDKIDTTVEQLTAKFQNIFEAAVIGDKSKELLAMEALTIEADALAIVRLCEELLTTTRGLRETWCLGTLAVRRDAGEEMGDMARLHQQFNDLTDNIALFEQRTR